MGNNKIKKLPLVIFKQSVFKQQSQWFALEASFVQGQGRTEFLAADALLLPFSQLLTSKLIPKPLPINNTKHWLALAGGQLGGVSGDKSWLLGIEGEAELVVLPKEQIHPLPPLLLACRTCPALQAVAWHQQRLVSLIDARVLLTLAPPLLASLIPDVNLVEL